MKNTTKKKRAQSEMVGFALIVIIVSIIIVIFVSISLNKSHSSTQGKSYQTDSFLQSMLGYTTTCFERGQYLSLSNVITKCIEGGVCSDGSDPCSIMNESIKQMVDNSWKVGGDYLTKGYDLNISSQGKTIYSLHKGNITNIKKESVQPFPNGERIIFDTYN